MRQPINSASSALFLGAAFHAGPSVLGLATAALAVGSVLHHGCECPAGDLDIHALTATLGALGWCLTESPVTLVVTGLTIAFWADITAGTTWDALYVAGGAVLLLLGGLMVYRGVPARVYVYAVLGIAAWLPEEVFDTCVPVHLHALWHCFTALALYEFARWHFPPPPRDAEDKLAMPARWLPDI
jgi:hypothetical protein